MTAYSAVADGRLTNEEVGALDRRWMGVRKRLDDRAIPVRWVMSELQRIAEGQEVSRGMRMVLPVNHDGLEIGGARPLELAQLVESACEVEENAHTMLADPGFTTLVQQEKIDLVFITPAALGTYKSKQIFNSEWLASWSAHHLYGQEIDICPPEVGPRLCMAMGKFAPWCWWTDFHIAMNSIPGHNGWPLKFVVRTIDGVDNPVRGKLTGVSKNWSFTDLLTYQLRQLPK